MRIGPSAHNDFRGLDFESNEHKREMRRTTVIDVQYAKATAA